MRLPRDLTGHQLTALLGRHYGYEVVRQSGSHLRLTTTVAGHHHITVPAHDALRVGTLAAILAEVARHPGVSRTEVQQRLFTERQPGSIRATVRPRLGLRYRGGLLRGAAH